jgi:3-oxoacyl-[acyl-carrier-protein] synthase-3
MHEPKYGFTDFIDCSRDSVQFKTVLNEGLPNPFGKIKERTHIETRQIAYSTVDITAMTRLAITRIFDYLNIKGKDCAGVVLASCNSQDQSDALAKIASRAAETHGIAISSSLNYACSGFPAAVERAQQMPNDSGKHVIIIMAEMLSKIVDWNDQNTAVVFGDGLAVTSILPGGKHEIIDSWARGNVEDPNNCLGFEEKLDTLTAEGNIEDAARLVITMGKHGGKYLYRNVPQALVDLVANSRVGLEGANRIVPHQANGKFIEKMIAIIQKLKLNVPVVGTIAHQANTASASIPTALAKTIDTFEPGEIIACPAKGAGIEFETGKLTQGLLLFKVGK